MFIEGLAKAIPDESSVGAAELKSIDNTTAQIEQETNSEKQHLEDLRFK